MRRRTTVQDPPITTITRTHPEATLLFEDHIRGYRRNQRRRYVAHQAIRRVARRISGGSYNQTLEQQIDLQVQLRLSMQERAAIVPSEVLYHSRRDDIHHRVYVHRAKEAILVTNNQIDRAFIQPESFEQLRRSGMQFIHMGIIQVRAQILHRREEGTLALVVFRDNIWQGDQAIFVTMEVDLTNDSQLVYVIPNTMLTISDFYRNIKISVLTHGYENWQNGEANLLITRGIVGRLSNTLNVGFAYEIQNVVDYLASHGVRALPGKAYNTRDVLGQNWMIQQTTVQIPMQRTSVTTRNLLGSRISIHFDNYKAASKSETSSYNNKDEEVQSDEEEIRSEQILVLVEQHPVLKVERLNKEAILPYRQTEVSKLDFKETLAKQFQNYSSKNRYSLSDTKFDSHKTNLLLLIPHLQLHWSSIFTYLMLLVSCLAAAYSISVCNSDIQAADLGSLQLQLCFSVWSLNSSRKEYHLTLRKQKVPLRLFAKIQNSYIFLAPYQNWIEKLAQIRASLISFPSADPVLFQKSSHYRNATFLVL
ncbi:hypothetical protein ZIOFF_043384 [Zingiber officinale]|uniref:Polyprotein n=1 Tax=Zingiber officinale TaxID=94328 RepID=A0A8J5FUU7_ZINOF|nr:hypothetical protein ZIOFF_043384 [Zingiber officinale]